MIYREIPTLRSKLLLLMWSTIVVLSMGSIGNSYCAPPFHVSIVPHLKKIISPPKNKIISDYEWLSDQEVIYSEQTLKRGSIPGKFLIRRIREQTDTPLRHQLRYSKISKQTFAQYKFSPDRKWLLCISNDKRSGICVQVNGDLKYRWKHDAAGTTRWIDSDHWTFVEQVTNRKYQVHVYDTQGKRKQYPIVMNVPVNNWSYPFAVTNKIIVSDSFQVYWGPQNSATDNKTLEIYEWYLNHSTLFPHPTKIRIPGYSKESALATTTWLQYRAYSPDGNRIAWRSKSVV